MGDTARVILLQPVPTVPGALCASVPAVSGQCVLAVARTSEAAVLLSASRGSSVFLELRPDALRRFARIALEADDVLRLPWSDTEQDTQPPTQPADPPEAADDGAGMAMIFIPVPDRPEHVPAWRRALPWVALVWAIVATLVAIAT